MVKALSVRRLFKAARETELWRWVSSHKVLTSIVGLLILGVVVDLWATTQHVRIDAKTDSVEIEFSQGQPIAWALGGARLLECSQLAQVTLRAGVQKIKTPPIPNEAEIALVAIEEVDKRVSTVRARISLHGNDLVVELEPLIKPKSDAMATAPECSKEASRVAVLDTGDGIHRGISLPAQLRLGSEGIANGLTLEFRGNLRVGNDVSSSSQPLLKSGRLTLREVRWHLMQIIADAQFDIESRDLGLGDKVRLTAQSLGEVPQGFVRIVQGERSPEMSVYATAVAKSATIVRPFSPPESPKANWIRYLLADELLSMLAAAIAAVCGWVIKDLFLPPLGGTSAAVVANRKAKDS